MILTELLRSLSIPAEVRVNDAAVADRDEALATWVADRNHELRRECGRIRERVPPARPGEKPGTDGGDGMNAAAERDYHARQADEAIAEAKGAALHEYRDEARRARLDVARILAKEGFEHRVYRRLTGRRAAPLTTLDRSAPVLDAWRKASAMSSRQVWPVDATRRTLDDAIADMPVTGP